MHQRGLYNYIWWCTHGLALVKSKGHEWMTTGRLYMLSKKVRKGRLEQNVMIFILAVDGA
jgi:hypothetical protein